MIIREARTEDLERILEIYDKYIVKKSIWSRLKEAWNIIRGKYTPHGEDGYEFV